MTMTELSAKQTLSQVGYSEALSEIKRLQGVEQRLKDAEYQLDTMAKQKLALGNWLKDAESQLESIEGLLWLRNRQLQQVDEDGAKVNKEWMRDHGNDELIGHIKGILKIRAF